ncbi:MAG: hypothetical protein KIS67_09310 [Verrucomicrobiae bacterium]|nr:hypothetical protein [Verrucomicrobiae bacterium]
MNNVLPRLWLAGQVYWWTVRTAGGTRGSTVRIVADCDLRHWRRSGDTYRGASFPVCQFTGHSNPVSRRVTGMSPEPADKNVCPATDRGMGSSDHPNGRAKAEHGPDGTKKNTAKEIRELRRACPVAVGYYGGWFNSG